MGYRSDIRMITSKDGYEKLKDFVKKYLEKYKGEDNLLEECDVIEENNQVYFGWNGVKWYEDYYNDVDAIMKGIEYLYENDYSYRYMRIGEDRDDYDEKFHDSDRKSEPVLDYPELIREFDDEYVIDMIKRTQEIELPDKEINTEELDI